MSEAQFDEPASNQALPHSIEAEQAVLGGLMLKNDAFDAININYRLLCEVFVEDVVSC